VLTTMRREVGYELVCVRTKRGHLRSGGTSDGFLMEPRIGSGLHLAISGDARRTARARGIDSEWPCGTAVSRSRFYALSIPACSCGGVRSHRARFHVGGAGHLATGIRARPQRCVLRRVGFTSLVPEACAGTRAPLCTVVDEIDCRRGNAAMTTTVRICVT
jgi:hypothetical protein